MKISNEEQEFVKEILKSIEGCNNLKVCLVGNGYTANVWKISDDLCLKVSTNLNLPNIPKEFKSCENLCVPLKTYYSKSGRYVGIVQKFLKFGNLQSLIKKKNKLSEEQVRSILFDIIKGLNVIHKAGFVHRDFHPGNIMLAKVKHNINAIIIDFDEMESMTLQTKACFRYSGYQAPEIVFDGDMYDDRSEMFVLGIIAWELVFGECPFGGYNFFSKVIEHSWNKYLENSEFYNNNVKKALRTLPYYMKKEINVSHELEKLLHSLLEPNRDERITAEQALLHTFFENEKN